MLGAGTAIDPYKISTPQDLHAIRNNLTAYYELTNNIDMSTFGNWLPIGANATPFKGSFDGKGYIIDKLSSINTGIYHVSFIGATSGAIIKNVGLPNINISSDMSYTGTICSSLYLGTMENCYSTGEINANSTVGGLIGSNQSSTVKNCFSTCKVTSNQYGTIGGLIGTQIDGTIENCFSTGQVIGVAGKSMGGLISSITGTPTITNCFWDTQTSGQSTSAGGTPKTTIQMQTQSTFVNWDFTNTWTINNSYPTLRVFGIPVVAKKEIFSVVSYISPFFTNLGKSIKTTKQLNSYANAILSDSKRYVATIKQLESEVSQIETNVIQSHRIVKSSITNVQSYISPIYSSVYRESKVVKRLLATVNSLEGSVDVIIPMNTKSINAYVSFVTNPSMASKVVNPSEVRVIQNPSYWEVIT